MACDAGKQPSTSTLAPTAETIEQQQVELRFSLEQQLDAIINLYDSQKIQLTDACWQIDETIIGEPNLSDPQQSQLCDWYVSSLEEVAARQVFTVRWGQREGGQGDEAGDVTLGANGGEAADSSQAPWDADHEEDCPSLNL